MGLSLGFSSVPYITDAWCLYAQKNRSKIVCNVSQYLFIETQSSKGLFDCCEVFFALGRSLSHLGGFPWNTSTNVPEAMQKYSPRCVSFSYKLFPLESNIHQLRWQILTVAIIVPPQMQMPVSQTGRQHSGWLAVAFQFSTGQFDLFISGRVFKAHLSINMNHYQISIKSLFPHSWSVYADRLFCHSFIPECLIRMEAV